MDKKDWAGWILFVIGFIYASIFGLNVPPWEMIHRGNIYYIILLVAQGLMILGSYNLLEARYKGEEKNKNNTWSPGMMKLILGGVVALVSIFIIAGNVPREMWQRFFLGAAIALLGAGFLGMPRPREHSHEPGDHQHIDPLSWINQLLDELGEISFKEQNSDSIKKSIEKIELERLVPFVKQRHSFSREFGATSYAEFFSAYSSGEMFINRAWSSLVDGYPGESEDSIENARQYFLQTREILEKIYHDEGIEAQVNNGS